MPNKVKAETIATAARILEPLAVELATYIADGGNGPRPAFLDTLPKELKSRVALRTAYALRSAKKVGA